MGEETLGFRVPVVMLGSLLGARRCCCSAARETDPNVSREDPRSLLTVWLLGDDCNDVSVSVGVHLINAKSLPNRAVGFGTATL